MATQEQGFFRDRELTPEKVWGSEYSIPTIIGKGSGQGFGFSGLNLPQGWERAGDALKASEYWEGFYKLLTLDCLTRSLKPGDLEVDSATGILTKVSVIHQGSEQSVVLSEGIVTREAGIYDAKRVNDARSAVTLHASVAGYLNHVAEEARTGNEYSYIDRGERGGYFSVGLYLPPQVEERMNDYPYESITHEPYRNRFQLKASNIAGRFGQTLKHLMFDERGVLTFVGLIEGSAQNYSLQSVFGDEKYDPHNVDTAEAAMALHGITAMHITDLRSILKSG